MRLAVLGLSALIAACATSLQEIRERAPVQTGDFPRPYQALARCVFDRLDAQTGGSGWDPLSGFIYRLDEHPPSKGLA
jgi:hypothetical protein